MIERIDEIPSTGHFSNCDCPICELMADGMFRVGFTSIDGHHLELDGDFAFSKHGTLEEWEQAQREYEEFSAKFNSEREGSEIEDDEDVDFEEDSFASTWSGIADENPIPGDKGGSLKMINQNQAEVLHNQLQSILSEIHTLAESAWDQPIL